MNPKTEEGEQAIQEWTVKFRERRHRKNLLNKRVAETSGSLVGQKKGREEQLEKLKKLKEEHFREWQRKQSLK